MIPLFSATWTLLAGAMVLFLPGLAWLYFFWDAEQDAFERLAEMLGVSIASSALIALLAYLLGLHLSSSIVILIYGLMAIPAFWTLKHWWQDRTWGGNVDQPGGVNSHLEIQSKQDIQTTNQIQGKLIYLSLALVFLVVLALLKIYQA